MIDEIDILSALKKRIEKFFPNTEVRNQDFKDVVYPSFQLNCISAVDSQSAAMYEINNFSFEIVYFAQSNTNGYLNLLDTKTILKAILNKPLKIVKTWQTTVNNVVTNYTKLFYVDIETSSSSVNKEDYTLKLIINISVEQKIDYPELGIDLDSDNVTDDLNFDRDILEKLDVDLTKQGQEISNFTE